MKEPLSFATFLSGSGERKVDEIEEEERKVDEEKKMKLKNKKALFLCQAPQPIRKVVTFRASAHSSTGALLVLLRKKRNADSL